MSVFSTPFSYYLQNTAATGRKMNSTPAKTSTSCQRALPRKAVSSFIPPIRYLYTLLRPPWVFSAPGWTVPALSAFPHERYSSPLIIFVGPCWTRSSNSAPFLYCGTQNCTQHSSAVGNIAFTLQNMTITLKLDLQWLTVEQRSFTGSRIAGR